jgi:hypothetical protein
MALVKGDIGFNSFNADEDGWSIVAFVDIDPNTTIYFSDGTATSPTNIGTNESSFLWNTGSSTIPAGTVVRFSAIDVTSRAVSIGTFAVVNSTNLGLSATSETVYAFLGSNGSTPTTILTAISNEASITSLTVVGLTAGTDAVKLSSSADYGVYNGPRSGQASFTQYKTLVNDVGNWIVDTVNGDYAATVPNTTNLVLASTTPTVTLSVNPSSGTEGDTTVFTITATASSAVSSNQTLSLGITGTGIDPSDYTLSSSILTIAAGATTGSITLTIVDDAVVEGTEIATLTLSNPSAGITLGSTVSQSITIFDNDLPPVTSAANAALVTSITVPGNATDLASGSGANQNRLGGFGSDFFYDYRNDVYYGLADRGPGGGVISYGTRVEKFSINIDPTTGAIANYSLLQTILFVIPAGTTLNGITYATDTPFNGLNATLLNGNGGSLGQSQDPEGFVVGANGNFFVSDEYGPSIYEFSPDGRFVRAFVQPSNVLPRVNGSLNFAADTTSTTGRQDNRGYEGLAISPDGTKLFAAFQDPLQEEGTPTGRNSRNVRIVRFDVATGQSDAQYIYQLESLTDINSRIPGTVNDFGATAQGRNIGISSLIAVNNSELLVIERDNRGLGVTDPLATTVVGSKQVFKIDLTGATDVSGISLTGTNTLPAGVTPVSKSTFLDIAGALQGAGQKVPEKIEGLAIGPQLSDGSFALVVATDNDFSVTQDAGNVQLDVYTNGVSTVQVPLNGTPPAPPAGEPPYTLIPSYIYSFKTQPAALNITPVFDFSLANYAIAEGNASGFSTSAAVTVTRRGSLSNTDTVLLQLANGTATGGSSATPGTDYNNSPITVTFSPNEISKTVLIPIAGDPGFEADETVNLSLANPSAGTLVGTKQPAATLTILNDDLATSTRIHDIQGTSHISPLNGKTVTNVPGIVTALAARGFYFQDPNPDNDDRTSEGIFVFTSSAPSVQVGDSVQVSGTVTEFRPANSATNLTTTEITTPTVVKLSSSNPLPAATVLGNGGRTIPNAIGCGSFRTMILSRN